MGLRQTHKQKFKMKLIYKTKKRRRLMQVERKWCGKLSRDNLKHKLYTTRKLFKRKHHSPPYGILYDSPRELHPNGIFFLGLPKLGLILSQGFEHAYLPQINFLEHARALYYGLQKDLSNDVLHALIGNHSTLTLRGFVVGNQIPNLTPILSFDHNSCISYLNEQ